MEKKRIEMDGAAKVVSAICIALAAVLIYMFFTREGAERWATGVCGLLLLSFFLFAPCAVSREGDELCVHSLATRKRFSLKEYDVERADEASLGGAMRVFGSGGLGGWWGIWRLGSGLLVNSYLAHRTKDVCLLRPKDPKKRPVLLNLPEELGV